MLSGTVSKVAKPKVEHCSHFRYVVNVHSITEI